MMIMQRHILLPVFITYLLTRALPDEPFCPPRSGQVAEGFVGAEQKSVKRLPLWP